MPGAASFAGMQLLRTSRKGTQFTQAPLAINGKIVVGVGGGEAGAHRFLSCFDAKDGRLLWQTYTVPRSASDPGADTWANGSWSNGGGTTWNTGSYDPDSNLIYWGTGNPAPDWDGEGRMGTTFSPALSWRWTPTADG
jgi:alcohol dehydrogenase (cytochrome c)